MLFEHVLLYLVSINIGIALILLLVFLIVSTFLREDISSTYQLVRSLDQQLLETPFGSDYQYRFDDINNVNLMWEYLKNPLPSTPREDDPQCRFGRRRLSLDTSCQCE